MDTSRGVGPVPYVDEHAAELLFRHKAIRLLQDEGLLSDERTELLLSWRHTSLSVYNRVRVEVGDMGGLERLARYILRSPISLERMSWDDAGDVHYRRKPGRRRSPQLQREPFGTFDPADFLARVIMHIPDPRRYGWYSNVSRGRRRRALEDQPFQNGDPSIYFLALVIQRVMRLRIKRSGLSMSPEELLYRLRAVQRHNVRLATGTTLTGVSSMTPEQRALFEAIEVRQPTRKAVEAAA